MEKPKFKSKFGKREGRIGMGVIQKDYIMSHPKLLKPFKYDEEVWVLSGETMEDYISLISDLHNIIEYTDYLINEYCDRISKIKSMEDFKALQDEIKEISRKT